MTINPERRPSCEQILEQASLPALCLDGVGGDPGRHALHADGEGAQQARPEPHPRRGRRTQAAQEDAQKQGVSEHMIG